MTQTLDELCLDMTAETYHASPGESNSKLKVFHASPRDYWAQYVGKTVKREPTAAMDFGTMAHDYILKPDRFGERYLLQPNFHLDPDNVTEKGRPSTNKGTKYVSERIKNWENIAGRRVAVTPEECDRLIKIHNAVYANEIANGLLQHKGDNEVSIFWDTDVLPRRSRLDRLAPPFIVDIKTTEQMSRWVHTANDKEYYRQVAYYLDAARHIDPSTDWRFVFVVPQTKAPFHVRCFEYGQDDIINTMGEINADLHDLRERIANDDWHDDRELGINEISIPRWKK